MPRSVKIDAGIDPSLPQPESWSVLDQDDNVVDDAVIEHRLVADFPGAHQWDVTVPDTFTTGTFVAIDTEGIARVFMGLDRKSLPPTPTEIENVVWDALAADHTIPDTLADEVAAGIANAFGG